MDTFLPYPCEASTFILKVNFSTKEMNIYGVSTYDQSSEIFCFFMDGLYKKNMNSSFGSTKYRAVCF